MCAANMAPVFWIQCDKVQIGSHKNANEMENAIFSLSSATVDHDNQWVHLITSIFIPRIDHKPKEKT